MPSPVKRHALLPRFPTDLRCTGSNTVRDVVNEGTGASQPGQPDPQQRPDAQQIAPQPQRPEPQEPAPAPAPPRAEPQQQDAQHQATPPREPQPDEPQRGIDDDFTSVYVRELRLVGFRGIEDLGVELEPKFTLLVGPNNVGKSRILRALALAFGAAQADRDDLTVASSEDCFVDAIIAPLHRDQDGDASFDERVTGKLGEDAQSISDDPVEERFGWRTRIVSSQEGFGVRAEQELLVFDVVTRVWRPTDPSTRLTPSQRSLLSADLIETRRDLADDLYRRGSAVRRVLDDLEVPTEKRVEIESALGTLSGEIVSSSAALGSIKAALDVLRDTVDGMGSAALQPLPMRLEELARTVSIDLDSGKGGLPLRFHGAGARSLASLQVQSVLYDKRMGMDGPNLRPRPLTVVEEPESHLHPQAQFELAGLLQKLRGQVVVSSHSTHLATVSPPESIRMLRNTDNGLTVADLKPDESVSSSTPRARHPRLHASEMEKLRRLIERPFGELLFASLVIIGDGATERALIPPILRHAFGTRAHGICVVDPGSMGGEHATAVVKFANLAGIPWLLFSDSDEQGVSAARQLVGQHGAGNESDHIVWVPKEPTEGEEGSATERMLYEFDKLMCANACSDLGFPCSPDDSLKMMSKQKGGIGVYLAERLITSKPWKAAAERDAGYWPGAIAQLCDTLDKVLPQRQDADGHDRTK